LLPLPKEGGSTRGGPFLVTQGGHDVPNEELRLRYPRTLANLKIAIRQLSHVLVFDNNNLSTPFRQVAVFEHGSLTDSISPIPEWLKPLWSSWL